MFDLWLRPRNLRLATAIRIPSIFWLVRNIHSSEKACTVLFLSEHLDSLGAYLVGLLRSRRLLKESSGISGFTCIIVSFLILASEIQRNRGCYNTTADHNTHSTSIGDEVQVATLASFPPTPCTQSRSSATPFFINAKYWCPDQATLTHGKPIHLVPSHLLRHQRPLTGI